MKKIIHVNQHIAKANRKTGARDPVITVKTYKSNDYAHRVEIKGPASVVYQPDNPQKCGAVCWVETESEIEFE